MSNRFLKVTLSLLLAFCCILQVSPVNLLSQNAALAESEPAAQANNADGGQPPAASDFSWALAAVAGQETLTEGEWRYALLPEYGYAVVTGHADTTAVSLTVPKTLGGADVVALATGALGDHQRLESLSMPGNLNAVSEDAIPRGTTLLGYSGSYAQRFARDTGYAFTSLSEYDFVDGVVDYADIAPAAFERVSQYEVRLRALEAARLTVGTTFFLIDLNNPYQISYYSVASMREAEDGFVVIACTTPEIEQVLLSYHADDMPMVMDMSTLELTEGVTLAGGGMRARGLKADEGHEFKVNIKPITITFDKVGKVEVSGEFSESIKASYDYGFLKLNKISVTETTSGKITAKVSYTKNQFNSVFDKLADRPVKEVLQNLQNRTVGYNGLKGYTSVNYELGRALLWSWAGIINISLSYGFTFEVSASGEFSYTFKTATEHAYENGQVVSTEISNEATPNVKIEGSIKAGFKISLQVMLFVVEIFSIDVFAGLKGTAAWSLTDNVVADTGNSPSYASWTTLPVNMWDCIEIKVNFMIEAEVKLGPKLKYNSMQASWKWTIVDWEICKLHLHVINGLFAIFDDKLTAIQGIKDTLHLAENCPYAYYTARFVLPWLPVTDKAYVYQTRFDLVHHDEVSKPGDPDLSKYNRVFEGWYTDASLEAQYAVTWPYEIDTESPVFYAKTANAYPVSFCHTNGKRFGSLHDLYRVGERVALPALPSGYELDHWCVVDDPATMGILEELPEDATTCVMPDHTLYLVAICKNDVTAVFHMGADDQSQSVFVKRGEDILPPDETPTRVRHTFAGWLDAANNAVAFPCLTGKGTNPILHFYPDWQANDEITAADLDGFYLGTDSTVSTPGADYSAQRYFTFTVSSGKATVTGFQKTQTDIVIENGVEKTYTYTVEPVNLHIPATYTDANGNDYLVTTIASSAFAGIGGTFTSVTVPRTVTVIGASAFANNAGLRLIDLSAATALATIPSNMAQNCASLACALIPNSVTAISSYAFAGCPMLTRGDLRASIGQYAFSGCTGLTQVTLGAQVTAIGDNAFSGCTGLTELFIPDSVTSLGNSFMFGCVNVQTLTIDGRPAKITSAQMNVGAGSHLRELVLGEGISELGANAFANGSYGFTELASVSLPDSLRNVGSSVFAKSAITSITFNSLRIESANAMFKDCPLLESVTVRQGAIPSNAFQGCTALTSVTLGEGVTGIGNNAFQSCSALNNVTLNEGLTTIGVQAFAGCTNLAALEIPDSVTSYGNYLFNGCTNLKRLVIGGGYVPNTTNPNLTFYVGANAKLQYLELREGVTSIGRQAFANYSTSSSLYFKEMETIVLPESLTSIGSDAFRGSGVETIVFKRNNVVIGSYAFSDSTRLKSLTLPGGSIGNNAFQGCTALTSVALSEGVTAIGSNAFSGCTNLESLEIPDSVTGYGDWILYNCKNLKRLVVGGGFTPKSSAAHTTFGIGEGSKLQYLEFKEGVTTTGDSTFRNFESNGDSKRFIGLETIIFPKSLKEIGKSAFSGSGVINIIFKGIDTSIGNEAFAGCSRLEKLSIPGGSIGEFAFVSCSMLVDVVLGESVTTIGCRAFAGCDALSNITLNDGLATIGDSAFFDCINLESLEIPDSVTSYGDYMIEGCTNIRRLVVGGGYIPRNISTCRTFIIGDNSKLQYLELREGIKRTGEEAFRNFDFWSQRSFNELEKIVLPASLTRIDYAAFEGTSVTNIIFEGDYIYLDSCAFAGSYRLESLSLTNGIIEGGAFADCSALTNITLGEGVTEIGQSAFSCCTALNSIVMSENLTKIGDQAFYGCTALNSVVMAEGLTKIGDQAFYGCTNLETLEIPDSVISYGNKMIKGCTNLKRLVIGGGYTPRSSGERDTFSIGNGSKLRYLELREGVTTISADTFRNYVSSEIGFCYYKELETLILPETLTTIGDSAFYQTGVIDIVITGNNVVIGDNAFYGSDRLKNLSLSGGEIGRYAFFNCPALTSVTLGEGVTMIGNYAFSGCTNLVSLEIPDSVTEYNNDMIYGCTNLKRLVIGGGYDPESRYTYSAFYIGAGSRLQYIEFREGVTMTGFGLFENSSSYSDINNYFNELETLVLPESLKTIGSNNIKHLPALKTLYIGSNIESIGDTDADLSGATIYSKEYSTVIDAYAVATGARYVVGDLPIYTLTLMNGDEIHASERHPFTGAIALPDIAPEGRTFDGWYTDAEWTRRWTGGVMPDGDLTLYARILPQYDLTAYTVLPDGTVSEFARYPVTVGERIPLPTEPVLDGYSLADWYADAELRAAWSGAYMPEGGASLYARMARVTAGGRYRRVAGGYELLSYALEQDESADVYLPSAIGGVPVVAIADYAFPNDDVTSLRLPSRLETVGEHAFDGMRGLRSLSVSRDNGHFSTKNGVLFDKAQTTLLRYPEGKSTPEYTPPDTVTAIARGALRDCKKLRGLTLPIGTKTLGAEALAGCAALTTFTAYGLEEIGENAIPVSRNLNVYGPAGSGALRDYCYVTGDSGSFMRVNYNLVTIDLYVDGAYYAAIGAEIGAPLPRDLELAELDGGGLALCWYTDSAMTTAWDFVSGTATREVSALYTTSTPLYEYEIVTLAGEGDAQITGAMLTAYHGTGGAVTLPRAIGGNTVIAIGAGFLQSANGVVASVDIGAQVISIAEDALQGASGAPYTGIVKADAGSYAAEWAQARGYAAALSTYALSFVVYSEQQDERQAAAGTAIRLPTPERQGAAFEGWYTDAAYSQAAALDEDGLFPMPARATVLYAKWSITAEPIPYLYTRAADGVTITGYTGDETVITVPGQIEGMDVTAIGARAFAKCAAESVTLPETAWVIGDGAFADCARLMSVRMNGAEEIGANAFSGCVSLLSISLPGTLQTIGAHAFAGCSGLTGVTLPDGVYAVADNAFSGCANLRSATLGAELYDITALAFSGCAKLESIAVAESNTNLMSIGGVLYSRYAELIAYPAGRADASYTVQEGTESVCVAAFAGAKRLVGISLPESVAYIGESAFMNCTSLSAFAMPSGMMVETLPEQAFFGCSALKTAALNAHVGVIEQAAFLGCAALERVELPETVTDISPLAFGAADGLTIIGKTGSEAQRYAAEHDIFFSDPSAVEPSGIAITGEAAVMTRGDSARLQAVVTPENAVTAVAWRSSDPAVADVLDGDVRAMGGGNAVIYATTTNGMQAAYEIEVQVHAASLSISPIDIIARGEQRTIEALVLPDSATNKRLVWTTDDERVATVDETGTVTGIGEGVTQITATTHNGIADSVEVTVYNPVESVALDAESALLYLIDGQNTAALTALITPEDATNTTVVWTSSDAAVASVDENGFVTARGIGETTVTATVEDASGVYTAACAVTVARKDISSWVMPALPSVVYDGGEHLPAFEIVFEDVALVAGEDYEVTCDDARSAGVHTVTVTGIGAYCGSVSGGMRIEKATPQWTYTGEDIFPLNAIRPTWTVAPDVPVVITYAAVQTAGEPVLLDGEPNAEGEYLLIARVDDAPDWNAGRWETAIAVVPPCVLEIRLSCVALTLRQGDAATFAYACAPEALASAAVLWTSADESVARVDEHGVITAVTPGETVITARVRDMLQASATCVVTVTAEKLNTLALPAMLERIDDEAFMGCATVDEVRVGANTAAIGARAFAGMTALKRIDIPSSVTQIESDAFDGNARMVILCDAGSAAETFARTRGIPYVLR